MRKLKLLMAACALVGSAVTAWAQTDVTSTYLTNADFSSTTAIDNHLCGYGKDMADKSTTYYGFQLIDGWTFVVTSGDNSNANYPNSGMGGAVFAYGTSWELKGNNKTAPAKSPDGGEGKCLGFFGVWGCGGYYYQNVTLPAGKYTLSFPIYNQSGTQANTTYTGFFPTSGTNRTVAINTTVGSWVTQTITFSLASETTGQIRIGYQSTGGGSGANPHLFFDCVKIEYEALVIKTTLETALNAAKKANSVLSSSDLAAAISTAQTVYDDEDATQDDVNNAVTALNAATELAMSVAGDVTAIYISNPGFESCTETTTNAAAGGSAAPLNISGNWTQVSSAAWSSSAVVAYGGTGQVNGASAPSTDNAGNTGKTLGISVGWSGLVTYKTEDITLPSGVYTLKAYAYNNLSGVTQFTSKLGFVPSEGASSLSTKTSYTYGTWETDQVGFTLNEATTGYIQIGGQAISGGSGSNAKVFFDNITLTYKSFLTDAKEAWDEALDAANAAYDNAAYANVIGTERSALKTQIDATEPSTVDDYNTATEALITKTSAFTSAKTNYDALVAEIAYAKTIGIATATADSYAATSYSTAATVLASTENLKVNEYTHIKTSYPQSQSTRLGAWTEDFPEDLNGEGYVSGGDTYWNEWGTNTRTGKQTVTLPAGDYAISCIGRGGIGTSGYLYYKIGDASAVTADFLMKGNRGRGVDTSGDANFAESGTYTCDNSGFGWEYRYLVFTLSKESTVEIGVSATFKGNWVSIYAPQLFSTELTEKNSILTDIANILTTVPSGKMNSTVASTLESKTSAGEGATTSNTVSELNTIKSELGDAITAANASIEAYTALKTNLDNVATTVSTTNVYTGTAYATYYSDVLDSWTDESITTDDANAYSYGSRVTGAMPAIMLSAWKVGETAALTDASLYMNTWSTEGNSDGSDMTTPFYEYWVADANALTAKTFTATVEGLTAGTNYLVTAKVRVRQQDDQTKVANDVTFQVNDGEVVNAADGTQSSVRSEMYYKTVRAFGVADEDGKLAIKVVVKDGNHVSWLAFKDVNYSEVATPTDAHKTALASAISTAESKTIGFEEGEYAPYTNIDARKALVAAKAINDNVNNYTDYEVVAATTALTGATWDDNDEEMNAVSDELFNSVEYATAGWTRSVTWNNVGNDGSYSIPYGTMTYGAMAYHEMPLKAETIYTLSFGHRKWDSSNADNGGTVSVLNENSDGLAATSYTGTSATTLQTETIDFLTGDAGNYTFTISAASGRLTFGNVTIKQAVAKPITISEEATSAPVFWFANATLTRTFSASYWNTFSVPFDMEIPDGWTVKEFDSAVDNVINFKTATTIEAGKPYLVKPAENVVNPTFNGVVVENIEGETVGEGAYKFAAQIYNKSLPTDGTIAYLSTDGKVKKLTSGGIKGLRAYFIIPASGASARIAFLDDDEQTTGINEMKSQPVEDGNIYDLNGRRVQTMKKGIYVVNGKKIVK